MQKQNKKNKKKKKHHILQMRVFLYQTSPLNRFGLRLLSQLWQKLPFFS